MVEKEKGKEVAKKEETALAKPVEHARGGLAHESIEDLDLPHALLLQPTSPQVVAPDSKLKAGKVVDSYFSEELPATFIPISVSKRWVKYRSQEEGGGVEWSTRDALDSRVEVEGKWKDGQPPAATEIWDYVVFFEGKLDLPMMISFSKTSFGAGRRLYSLFKFSKQDMWNRKYKYTAKMIQGKKKGKNVTYYVYIIDPAGEATKEERSAAMQWYTSFGSKQVAEVVDDEAGRHEPEVDADKGKGVEPEWAKEDKE